MVPHVQILEDRFTTNAQIRIDGQPVSSLSPLSACSQSPFAEYAAKLPGWLHRECNGAFTVQFSGGALEECILGALFGREPACKGFSVSARKKEAFPLSERLKAAQRLWKADPQQTPPSPVQLRFLPGDALQQELTACLQGSRWKPCGTGWSLYPTCSWSPALSTAAPGSCTLFVEAAGGRHWPGETPALFQAGDLLYCADPAAPESPRFSGFFPAASGGFVPQFTGRPEAFPAFAALFAETFVTRPALARLRAALSAQPLHPGVFHDSFEETALRTILTSPLPVARITLPETMEIGDSHRGLIQRYPENVPLELHGNTAAHLQQSGSLYTAVREGRLALQLCTHGFASPEIVLDSKTLCIRRVNRVQQITLALTQPAPVPGQEFRVAASFFPRNAENLAQALWSVEPAGLAVSLGGGRFRALRAGSGRIRLMVGQVQSSLCFSVKALPTAIRLPPQIDVRMQQEAPVAFSLLPAGVSASVCGRTLDTDIAVFDPVRSMILPRREGSTTLELSVPSPAGGTACIGRCSVVVHPEHDVITPDWATAGIALTGTLGLLSAGTPLSLLLSCSCIAISLWQSIFVLQQVRQSKAAPKDLWPAAAGGIGSLLLLLLQLL